MIYVSVQVGILWATLFSFDNLMIMISMDDIGVSLVVATSHRGFVPTESLLTLFVIFITQCFCDLSSQLHYQFNKLFYGAVVIRKV